MKLINTAIIATTIMITAVPVLAADAAAGMATFNAKGCIGCHGAGGGKPVTTNPPTPSLVGKDAAFIKKQLIDFKTGARKSATMNAMAPMLSDVDVDNVAAYLSTQK